MKLVKAAAGILLLTVGLSWGGNNWIKVNGSNPLDNGELLKREDNIAYLGTYFTSVKTGNGDLIYIFSYDTMGPIMGRFTSGGDSPVKEWKVYTDDGWSGDSDAIAASISNSLAVYQKPIKLYALADDANGLFGVTAVYPRNSTGDLNFHGYLGNIVFDYDAARGIHRWRQWKSEATYDTLHIKRIVSPCFDPPRGDFAYNPDLNTGILVATIGKYNDKLMPKLVAAKYIHNDSNQKWHRWDNERANKWVSSTSWPGYRDVGAYHILDPNAGVGDQYVYPEIVYLGSDVYVVVFGYNKQGGSYKICAARYDEISDPQNWYWWGPAGWEKGGDYDYGTIVSSFVSPVFSSMDLIKVDSAKASLFYVKNSQVYEVSYDDAAQTWDQETSVAEGDNFTAAVASDKTVWLYYHNGGGTDLYLSRKDSGGDWNGPELVYSSPGSEISVLGANFVGPDDVPICFIAETVNGDTGIYAISPADYSSYWAQESVLKLKHPPVGKMSDGSIMWDDQVENTAPPASYAYYGSFISRHLGMDSDGYLYSPDAGNCKVAVRNKDADWRQAKWWGGFWDYINHPGGCAAYNAQEKVYVSNNLIPGVSSSGYVGRSGAYISTFDMAKRTTNLGYAGGENASESDLWDQVYYPQEFGEAVWPSDVAVYEGPGVTDKLYVTSSTECKVKIYDIENVTDNNGPDYAFAKSHLKRNISGPDNLARADGIISALIGEGYLAEKNSDEVYWVSTDLDATYSFVETLGDYDGLSADQFRYALKRNLGRYYRLNRDVPVELSSFGDRGTGQGEFLLPQGIDVDPEGNVYVVDTLNHRVEKFDSEGVFERSWGGLGYGDGEFVYPFSVAADPHFNLVYVTDPFNHRVQIFDRTGNFIYSWGQWKLPETGSFSNSCGIVSDGAGNIYVGIDNDIAKFRIVGANRDNNQDNIPDVLQGLAFAIYAVADDSSSISPTGDIILDADGSQTFSITAETTDYYDLNVIVDGVPQGDVSSYSFENVSGNHTIEVATNRIDNTTQGKNYSSIQAAIDAAADGDVIVVRRGVYHENISFSGKRLTLRSTDPNNWDVVEDTIIEAEDGSGSVVYFGWRSICVLKGFTIRNAIGPGVDAGNGPVQISNCIIEENSGAGILGDADCTITDNIIRNNGKGIHVTDESVRIRNNLIYDNGEIGVMLEYIASAELSNNTIIGHSSKGILRRHGAEPAITNCIMWDNNDDLDGCGATYSCIEDGDVGTGNIADDPQFVAGDSYYRLRACSPCVGAGDPDYVVEPNEVDLYGNERVNCRRIDLGACEYQARTCTCPGDLSGDRQVDLDDLQLLAGRLLDAGSPFVAPCP